MSTVSAPFGLQVANNEIGQSRARPYTIASGYAANIFYGDPVILVTAGTVQVSAGNDDPLGIFAGCEYIDATGKPTLSKFWPTGTTATNIVAWVYDNADNELLVQVTANASGFVQAVIGDQVNISIGSGSTVTGNSNSSVAAAAVGAGNAGQYRVVAFADGAYDATLNPYPILRVKASKGTYMVNKTAI
jgi:hypothetical protein